METKRDLEAKARDLIGTNPDVALKIYRKMWETYPQEFNEWDAFYSIKAMREAKFTDLNWANELAEKFKTKIIGNIYGWLIFDKCVKGKSELEIIANEKFIQNLINISPQKNQKENNSIPCPTTISILKLCDAHAKNQFNARKINELLSGLDYNFLSDKPKIIDTQERGKVELLSDLEKYFILKTKALLKLKEFDKCIEYCNKGLALIKNFHCNNDFWLKRRIALSEYGLGNYEKSEKLLKELLESKEGYDKWFLYMEISKVYLKQGNFEKAWKYAVDATFYGNEPHFLIELYLIQSRILYKLNRASEGRIIAELIAAILKEQKWKEKDKYSKLFAFYKIDKTKVPPFSELIKQAKILWQKERYGNKPKSKGIIISIHKNGKIGRIKDENNDVIEFHKKNFVNKMKSIENLKGATVEFYKMQSYDGKNIAECIVIIKEPPTPNSNNLIGKIFEGIVKNVTDFGIFIHIQGLSDGLLHKNSLPNNLKNNFKEVFTRGKKVNVKVERITEKGIQLILADNV
ncbi:MAG: S1 RNA-binding domain-containing protein [Bacteroidales bacterium]|nr:S1 RNA-binding domain-containing protein [Bacteroidales bacterium]